MQAELGNASNGKAIWHFKKMAYLFLLRAVKYIILHIYTIMNEINTYA